MAKISPLAIAPPLIFAALAAMFFFGMGRDDSLPSTLIGKPAPNVPEQGLAGYPKLEQADLATGDVVVLNFWASWCPPCRAEHPTLLAMKAEGIDLVGINFKDDADDAARYLEREENPFRALGFDPQGRVAIDWGVTAPPETFILDGEGKVLFRFAGPLVGSDYQQRFLPELRKAQRDQ